MTKNVYYKLYNNIQRQTDPVSLKNTAIAKGTWKICIKLHSQATPSTSKSDIQNQKEFHRYLSMMLVHAKVNNVENKCLKAFVKKMF